MDIKNIQKLKKIYIYNKYLYSHVFYVIYKFDIFYFSQILNLELVF